MDVFPLQPLAGLRLGVLKDIADTIPECPHKLKDIPNYQESLEYSGMDVQWSTDLVEKLVTAKFSTKSKVRSSLLFLFELFLLLHGLHKIKSKVCNEKLNTDKA